MKSQQQFIETVNTYKAVIYKVCYLYARPDELEDYYQEVVMQLWRTWPQFRGESSFATWIYRISLYTCLSFVRRRYARPTLLPLSVGMHIPDDDDGLQQRLKELRTAIDRLGQLDKALILLWLEEKSYDEIAEITGLTRSNVAVRLTRIREKIKRMSNQQ